MSREVAVPRSYHYVATATYRDGTNDIATGEAFGSNLGEALDNAEFERIEDATRAGDSADSVVRISLEVWEA